MAAKPDSYTATKLLFRLPGEEYLARGHTLSVPLLRVDDFGFVHSLLKEILRMVEGSAKPFDLDTDMGKFVAKKTPAQV